VTSRSGAGVAELAAAQHGVVSRAQLLDIGLGYRAIDHRIAGGLLHPIHRGVYAVGHRRLSREGAWMAAVLASGPGAVLSHRSAATLWGIRNTARADIEVTAPRRCRHPKIDAHHVALPADEVTTEAGIPVTNPARTLLDLAAVLTPQQLAHALNEAEIRRLASPLPLDALVARYPGRRGTTALKRALAQLREIGETITKSAFEERFRAFLEDHVLPRPRMNAPLGPYTPDAVWPTARLVVELDSYGIHTTKQAFEQDRARDRALTLAGYRVIRITWRQLTTDADAIAHELSELLEERATPSPRSARRARPPSPATRSAAP
jgi:very-short-patch-repair endonuclease/predicted transcriptional regulator of viral defense system